jgi:hypothetical protein
VFAGMRVLRVYSSFLKEERRSYQKMLVVYIPYEKIQQFTNSKTKAFFNFLEKRPISGQEFTITY